MGGVSAERLYHGYYLKTKTRGWGFFVIGADVKNIRLC